MSKRLIAVPAVAALAIAPLVALASPASADVTKRGTCGPGTYEFQVDRDGKQRELSADLDGLAPGSRWKVTLTHNGQQVRSVVRTADDEGELDVDADRTDKRGTDRYRFTAKPVGGGAGCGATIRVA